jgi:hypothetical protein
MRWARKTAFVSHAIDADYESEYFQVSPGRWWSYSRSTRVQEVEHYGRPDERLRPAGTGAGYIWRLFSLTDVTDFESGCIVEVRAMVLSRDVPPSLAWFVNPIVTRIARSALTTTLKQTREAARPAATLGGRSTPF